MRADALGQAPFCHARVEITNEIEAIFNEMLAENAVFSLHDLKISGSDLLAEGIPQGPQIGEILKAVLHEVTEEGLENNRANLLEFVRNNYL
jgi:tRNA nucleotidyltransferase (CCA-adding enzyme)